jgi:uncharacterized membrane protein
MGPPFIEKTCPHCHQKQLGVPVFPTGRLSLGSPRSATPLVRIIVFREGPIPPDGEDIHELLEHISPDALETPGVEISTFPVPVWPADIAALAHTILQDMEDKGELPPGSVSSAIGWPFQKKEHGIHGYLVKVSQPSPEQARIIMNEQEAEKEKGIGAPTNTLEDEVERREEQGFLKKFWRSFLLLGQPISGKKRQSARSPDSIPAPPSPRASAQEPTFDEVTTRDVTKAIDVLFNEALCAVPAMTPSTIEAAYEVLRKHWASRALYNGKQTQMREIVSHNLVLLARRTDFLYFMIKNGRDDAGEHYVQVYALMGKTIASRGTAVAIRLWRSQERIFACGHAGFEESPKAVLEEVSQKVLLELEDLVKQHVVHARRPFADDISALQWDLLLRSDILAFTTHSIARLTPLSTQNGTHACLGRRLSDAIVVVSVVPALMPSYAMTYFPKGYMETLVALMNRYEFDRKGSSPFIHWIYCFDSNAQMIHLSFLSGASEASAMLVAQDLLSREEKTQIGIL